MKSRIFVPVMLALFLCGSMAAMGQDLNNRKVKRIIRKIERQNDRLRELQGNEFHVYGGNIDKEEMEKIRQEALADREEAMKEVQEAMQERKEAFAEQQEEMNLKQKEMQEQIMIMKDGQIKKIQELKELGKLKELEGIGELEGLDKLKELKEFEGQMKAWKDDEGNMTYYYKAPDLKYKYKVAEPFVAGAPNIAFDAPIFKGDAFTLLSGKDALSIEKELTGETISADFNYEVKSGAEGISLSVNGSIEAGTVVITVKKPDGTVFNTYNLSPLANVSWKQSLTFDDQEESSYVGKWTVTVAAEGAKGKYNFHMIGR
ncbi:MAG: hypothetical protein V2A67_00240 [Bacteroidota bacterium]